MLLRRVRSCVAVVTDGTDSMWPWLWLQCDIKKNALFLKRCEYPSVKVEHLYIGARVTVFSRQLVVVGYADEFTRKKLESRQTRTLVRQEDQAPHLEYLVHVLRCHNAIYVSLFSLVIVS